MTHKYLSPHELLVTCDEPPPPRPPIAVEESPHVVVETEAELDKALEVGRSPVFRGLVPITTAKWIRHPGTTWQSEDGRGGIVATLDPASAPTPRAITVVADDVTLRKMLVTSTTPVEETTAYGIAMAEGPAEHCHRLTLEDLEVCNWARCWSKDGGAASPVQQDVRVLRCYFHTFSGHGIHPNFGLERMHIKQTRVLGRVGDAKHRTQNAFYGGSLWTDCVLEDCTFGNVTRMGCEVTIAGYTGFDNVRTRFIRCLAHDTGSFGFSSGFAEDVLFQHCRARRVFQVGFELAGRHPTFEGAPPSAAAWGSMDGCEVDGVTGIDTGAKGFSIDGTRDVQIRGATRISNLSSTNRALTYGIDIHASDRCSIRGATLRDFGVYGLLFRRGYAPNTGGHHVAEGNEFHNSPGDGECVGIHVQDTTVACRNNTNWKAPGTKMNNQTHCAVPARTVCDGGGVLGDAYFAGTNVTVPA